MLDIMSDGIVIAENYPLYHTALQIFQNWSRKNNVTFRTSQWNGPYVKQNYKFEKSYQQVLSHTVAKIWIQIFLTVLFGQSFWTHLS